MADQPKAPSIQDIPDNVVLPARAVAKKSLDWQYKRGLSPIQLLLLQYLEELDFQTKAAYVDAARKDPNYVLPASKIKQEYMLRQKRSAAPDSLEDTTRSDLA